MNHRTLELVLILLMGLFLSIDTNLAQRAELYVETGINHQGRAVAFSPDGKLVAGGGIDRLIKIWNLESGRELFTLPTNITSYQLAFNPHNQTLLASLTEMNTIDIWDITVPKRIAQLDVGNYYNASFAFLTDQRMMVFADPAKGKLRSWETVNWSELPEKTLTLSEQLSFGKLSQDGKKIVAKREYGKNTVVLNIDSPNDARPLGGSLKEVIAFSPDNTFLLEIDSGEGKINQWNISSGKSEFVGRSESLKGAFAAPYSLKGDLIAAVISGGKEDGTIVILETKNWTVKNKLRGYNNRVEKVGILPDTNLLAVQLWYDTMKYIDLESGNLVERGPNPASGFSIDLNEKTNLDGKEILVEKNNFVVNLKDESGNLLCTIIFLDKLDNEQATSSGKSLAVKDSHWLVATPDGFFDGTSEAQKHILWRFSRNLFDVTPVQAFNYEYYYPGLLKKVLMGKSRNCLEIQSLLNQRTFASPRLKSVKNVPVHTNRDILFRPRK